MVQELRTEMDRLSADLRTEERNNVRLHDTRSELEREVNWLRHDLLSLCSSHACGSSERHRW